LRLLEDAGFPQMLAALAGSLNAESPSLKKPPQIVVVASSPRRME